MVPRRAPGLSLELSKDGNSLVMQLASGRSESIPCELSDGKAIEYRQTVKKALDDLKNRISEKPPSVMDAHAALGELHTMGLTLIWQIFLKERTRVEKFFRIAFPNWLTSEQPFRISMAAELGRFLPLEFMPLFDLSSWPPLTNDAATLKEAVRRFPGFSVVIQREFRELSVIQDAVLTNEPKLSLRCFSSESLAGASEEVSFFAAHPELIDLEGPWPTSPFTYDAFSESLARHLRYGDERFDGSMRVQSDQVQHFACHCEVDDQVTSNSRLILAFDNEISIGALQARFATWPDPERQPRPLIFLNACGAAGMDPMRVTSFPLFFLRENGNRGFIGTEINVPDSFAAAFSRSFYEKFLSGLNLGNAIHGAKLEMLNKLNNPLGILYTVYADTELRVSRPIKELAPKDSTGFKAENSS